MNEAKNLIEMHGHTWTDLNIERTRENLEEFKLDCPGAKSVPQIFNLDDFDAGDLGLYIGGYDSLVQYFKLKR